ncbi:MAG: hypothetical protein ACXW0J_05125, partial [Nitrososphaeraceae archaeon]
MFKKSKLKATLLLIKINDYLVNKSKLMLITNKLINLKLDIKKYKDLLQGINNELLFFNDKQIMLNVLLNPYKNFPFVNFYNQVLETSQPEDLTDHDTRNSEAKATYEPNKFTEEDIRLMRSMYLPDQLYKYMLFNFEVSEDPIGFLKSVTR